MGLNINKYCPREKKYRGLLYKIKLRWKLYLRWVKYQHKRNKDVPFWIDEHNKQRDIELKEELKQWKQSIKEFIELLPGCGCGCLVFLLILFFLLSLITGQIHISTTTIIIILLLLILFK